MVSTTLPLARTLFVLMFKEVVIVAICALHERQKNIATNPTFVANDC